MEHFILYAGIYLVALMALSLYRAAAGPTCLDRLVGMNAIGSETVVLTIIIGLIFQRVDMFVDIALAYAMLNFISVLAASRYFLKRGMADKP